MKSEEYENLVKQGNTDAMLLALDVSGKALFDKLMAKTDADERLVSEQIENGE